MNRIGLIAVVLLVFAVGFSATQEQYRRSLRELREKAREERNWETADTMRQRLSDIGLTP